MDRVNGKRKVARGIGVAVGALIIVAAGVYTPLVLSADAKPATATLVTTESGGTMAPVPLPESGSSAVRLNGTLLAQSRDAEPRPIAGAAKLITALVVLDQFPIAEGEPGASIPISTDDDVRYRQMRDELGYRTVPVAAGQVWTEREVVEAALMSSSNNHAELLATWAFGSVDAYLTAAAAWLDDNGFHDTDVADPTGISPENVGTAADLARLSELAFADPLIGEVMQQTTVRTTAGTRIDNATAYLPEKGVVALSRSYTDASAITLLFALTIQAGDTTVPVYGAILGSPSYPTLEQDLSTLADAAAQNVTEIPLLAKGETVAVYTTEWGDRAEVVAAEAISTIGWTGAAVDARINVDPIGPTPAGTRVGSAVYELADGEHQVRLVLATALDGPDPIWRLTHPFALIGD